MSRSPRSPVSRGLVWVAVALGWAVIGFAVNGLTSDHALPRPGSVLGLLVGLNVVNDALVIPVAVAVAFVVRRWCPTWALAPVQVGLIISSVVVLFAYPLVRAFGRNPVAGYSRLPWDYGRNLVVVLGVVWGCCALLAVWSWWRARSA